MPAVLRDDLPLPYLLTTPSRLPEDAELPLVVVMHGRGADAHDLADIAPMIDGPGGYRFVFPNAPKAWEAAPGMTYGYTWFDGWPPAGSSIEESRALLLDFLRKVTDRYPTPPGQVVVTGFSQGALMALDAALRSDISLAGAVAMSGGLYENGLPDLSARRSLPVLLVHGTMDDVIPVNAARRARHILESHGLSPEYDEFPMGHHVTQESMARVGEFLQRVLS